MKSVVVAAAFILAIVFCQCQATWLTEFHDTEEDDPGFNRPFSVVTGPIREDGRDFSSEEFIGPNRRHQTYEGSNWPLSQHVDFDERFPGEDQIAEETEWIGPRRHHPQVPVEEDDDSLVVPAYRPTTLWDIVRRNSNGDDPHSWLDRVFISNTQPWWKGSNVCIKREEREEDASRQDEDELPLKDDATVRTNITTSGQAEFHMQFSACQDLDTKYSCTTRLYGPEVVKTIQTDYECCSGYMLDQQRRKCQRTTYENVLRTIEELGGTEFTRLAKSVGLENKMKRENITIFVPNNEAMNAFLSYSDIESNSIEFLPPSFVESESRTRRQRSILRYPHNEPGGRNVRRRQPPNQHVLPDADGDPAFNPLGEPDDFEDEFFKPQTWKQTVLKGQETFHRQKKLVPSYTHESRDTSLAWTLMNHMVQGTLSTDDFVDEKVIYSEDKGSGGSESRGGVLRLNKWQLGQDAVKTVNCARLVSSNHRCTNGMVHIVDSVIRPVTKSIYDVVSEHSQLSVWKSLLTRSGFDLMMKDPKEHLTLFAPTNAALEKLGASFLMKLQNGDPCLNRIVRHHILPLTFCSSIIYGKGVITNIDHDQLSVQRTADDRIMVNGSQVVTRDIVTTNGVVHVIDTVIMSENDKPLVNILRQNGYTTFLEHLTRAGLIQRLDEISNVTVFAPRNEAFSDVPKEVLDNREKLRDVLLYHISTPETRACHVSHQELLPTLLANQSIRINLYTSFPLGMDSLTTAQCGRLTSTNLVACNGVIHEVNRILIPPTLSIPDALSTQKDFSIFRRLLSDSPELTKELVQDGSFFTMFVPTDRAFYTLPKDKLQSILDNRTVALALLKRHITTDALCCAGVSPNLYFMTKRVATLGDVNVPVYRNPGGQIMFGRSLVTSCDVTASNGIIHTIDKVLEVEPVNTRTEQVGPCLPETLDNFDIRSFFVKL